jgi:hypothetical protein
VARSYGVVAADAAIFRRSPHQSLCWQ